MSFVHHLSIGHFEHDQGFVRLATDPKTHVIQPVIQRSLDMAAVDDVLHEVQGTEGKRLSFPEEWHMWLADGYLICNRNAASCEAIDFIIRLAGKTGCEAVDVGAFYTVTMEELRFQRDELRERLMAASQADR